VKNAESVAESVAKSDGRRSWPASSSVSKGGTDFSLLLEVHAAAAKKEEHVECGVRYTYTHTYGERESMHRERMIDSLFSLILRLCFVYLA